MREAIDIIDRDSDAWQRNNLLTKKINLHLNAEDHENVLTDSHYVLLMSIYNVFLGGEGKWVRFILYYR